MPQEKHKSLDQRNFHQDVAETDGYEVQQWHEMLLRRSSVQHHRPNQEGQYRHDGDDQQYPQNQQAKVVLPVDTVSSEERRVGKWCWAWCTSYTGEVSD